MQSPDASQPPAPLLLLDDDDDAALCRGQTAALTGSISTATTTTTAQSVRRWQRQLADIGVTAARSLLHLLDTTPAVDTTPVPADPAVASDDTADPAMASDDTAVHWATWEALLDDKTRQNVVRLASQLMLEDDECGLLRRVLREWVDRWHVSLSPVTSANVSTFDLPEQVAKSSPPRSDCPPDESTSPTTDVYHCDRWIVECDTAPEFATLPRPSSSGSQTPVALFTATTAIDTLAAVACGESGADFDANINISNDYNNDYVDDEDERSLRQPLMAAYQRIYSSSSSDNDDDDDANNNEWKAHLPATQHTTPPGKNSKKNAAKRLKKKLAAVNSSQPVAVISQNKVSVENCGESEPPTLNPPTSQTAPSASKPRSKKRTKSVAKSITQNSTSTTTTEPGILEPISGLTAAEADSDLKAILAAKQPTVISMTDSRTSNNIDEVITTTATADVNRKQKPKKRPSKKLSNKKKLATEVGSLPEILSTVDSTNKDEEDLDITQASLPILDFTTATTPATSSTAPETPASALIATTTTITPTVASLLTNTTTSTTVLPPTTNTICTLGRENDKVDMQLPSLACTDDLMESCMPLYLRASNDSIHSVPSLSSGTISPTTQSSTPPSPRAEHALVADNKRTLADTVTAPPVALLSPMEAWMESRFLAACKTATRHVNSK